MPTGRWPAPGSPSCCRGRDKTPLSSKALSFFRVPPHSLVSMRYHASCAARDGHGVLLLGAPGSGKSDLLLRLIERGFALVADDQVHVDDDIARPPPTLAGLLEIRGLGILRFPYVSARIALVVTLGDEGERLPLPSRNTVFGVPEIIINPWAASAPLRVALALDCAIGRQQLLTGAFA